MKRPSPLKSFSAAVPFFRLLPGVLALAVVVACSHNSGSPQPIQGPVGPVVQQPMGAPAGLPPGYGGPGMGQPNGDTCPPELVSDFQAGGTCMNGGETQACQDQQEEFIKKYPSIDCEFTRADGSRVNINIEKGQLHVGLDRPDVGAPTQNEPSNGEISLCPARVQAAARADLKMCREIENDEESAYDSELKRCEDGISDFLNQFSAIDCEMPARGGQPAYELSSDNVTEQRTRVEHAIDSRDQDQDGDESSSDDHGAITNEPGAQTVIQTDY